MPDVSIQGYPDNLRAFQVTIAAGASVSEMFATQGYAIAHVIMPTAWTAAKLAYKTTWDGSPAALQFVKDSGANYEKTAVAASINVAIPQADTVYAPFMQLVSVDGTEASTSATPVNQVAAAVITLLLRKYLS